MDVHPSHVAAPPPRGSMLVFCERCALLLAGSAVIGVLDELRQAIARPCPGEPNADTVAAMMAGYEEMQRAAGFPDKPRPQWHGQGGRAVDHPPPLPGPPLWLISPPRSG